MIGLAVLGLGPGRWASAPPVGASVHSHSTRRLARVPRSRTFRAARPSPLVTPTARPAIPAGTTSTGSRADGCESRSDYVAGTALTAEKALHANLVPASASDAFITHVKGDALALCWGTLHVTLTAPAGTAERLTMWRGDTTVASALSADGVPATATGPQAVVLRG